VQCALNHLREIKKCDEPEKSFFRSTLLSEKVKRDVAVSVEEVEERENFIVLQLHWKMTDRVPQNTQSARLTKLARMELLDTAE
jgi:hypothetical protein